MSEPNIAVHPNKQVSNSIMRLSCCDTVCRYGGLGTFWVHLGKEWKYLYATGCLSRLSANHKQRLCTLGIRLATKRASMHEVALRPSERRSLEVDLFRVNESESYYKLKK